GDDGLRLPRCERHVHAAEPVEHSAAVTDAGERPAVRRDRAGAGGARTQGRTGRRCGAIAIRVPGVPGSRTEAGRAEAPGEAPVAAADGIRGELEGSRTADAAAGSGAGERSGIRRVDRLGAGAVEPR